jgi:hypothetical protein
MLRGASAAGRPIAHDRSSNQSFGRPGTRLAPVWGRVFDPSSQAKLGRIFGRESPFIRVAKCALSTAKSRSKNLIPHATVNQALNHFPFVEIVREAEFDRARLIQR